MPAPTVADVEAVAEADQTMPPKSTFFFPKILDGMVFNQLDPFDAVTAEHWLEVCRAMRDAVVAAVARGAARAPRRRARARRGRRH